MMNNETENLGVRGKTDSVILSNTFHDGETPQLRTTSIHYKEALQYARFLRIAINKGFVTCLYFPLFSFHVSNAII
jgi:hypothetical protein